ncbi:hypothetical protein A2U01_0085923, partial [Trifolium medium]|nr:hypothetical protein [Trifolium medium]
LMSRAGVAFPFWVVLPLSWWWFSFASARVAVLYGSDLVSHHSSSCLFSGGGCWCFGSGFVL